MAVVITACSSNMPKACQGCVPAIGIEPVGELKEELVYKGSYGAASYPLVFSISKNSILVVNNNGKIQTYNFPDKRSEIVDLKIKVNAAVLLKKDLFIAGSGKGMVYKYNPVTQGLNPIVEKFSSDLLSQIDLNIVAIGLFDVSVINPRTRYFKKVILKGLESKRFDDGVRYAGGQGGGGKTLILKYWPDKERNRHLDAYSLGETSRQPRPLVEIDSENKSFKCGAGDYLLPKRVQFPQIVHSQILENFNQLLINDPETQDEAWIMDLDNCKLVKNLEPICRYRSPQVPFRSGHQGKFIGCGNKTYYWPKSKYAYRFMNSGQAGLLNNTKNLPIYSSGPKILERCDVLSEYDSVNYKFNPIGIATRLSDSTVPFCHQNQLYFIDGKEIYKLK